MTPLTPSGGNAVSGCDRAEALLQLRRPREALSVLQEAIGRDPEDVRAHGLTALAHIRLDEFTDAAAAARRAIHLAPDGEWGHRLLAIALHKLGRHAEALGAATTAAQLDVESPEVLQCLSAVQLASGLPAEAHATARRLVTMAPTAAGAHQAVAAAARELQDYDTAEAAIRHALQLQPTSAEYMNDLGAVLLLTGRHDEARSVFLAAARADPSSAPPVHNLQAIARHDRLPLPQGPLFLLVPFQVMDAIAQSFHLRRAYRRLPPEVRDQLLHQPWRGRELWLPRIVLLMLAAAGVCCGVVVARGVEHAWLAVIVWAIMAMTVARFLAWRWSGQRRQRRC